MNLRHNISSTRSIVWSTTTTMMVLSFNFTVAFSTNLVHPGAISENHNFQVLSETSREPIHGLVEQDKKDYSHLSYLPLVPGHVVHQRKSRWLAERSLTTTPDEATTTALTPSVEEGHAQQVDALYQGYGEHYVDLWCGSPPQRQTVILNTGARGTAFPCSHCADDCGLNYHTDHYYQEQDSVSFHQYTCDECLQGQCQAEATDKGCQFGMSYVEGSEWWASEARDHCYIGGLHDKPLSVDDHSNSDVDPDHAVAFAFDLTFGCQTAVTGYFRTQLADGILGMNNSPYSFWKQMYQAGKMQDEKMFSLCYIRQPVADKNGTESGCMTLGGADDRLHTTPMVFTEQKAEFGTDFGVLLRRVHLRQGGGGDSALATKQALEILSVEISPDVLASEHVVVESGTTGTYLPDLIAEPFRQAWKQLATVDFTNERLHWTMEQIEELPTILLQFQGAEELNKQVGDPKDVPNLAGDLDPYNPYDVILAIPPSHYMRYNRYYDAYESMFFLDKTLGRVTLGANAMMGHDVLFDVKNGRLGWAESRCDYAHLVQSAGYDPTGQLVPAVSPTTTFQEDSTSEPLTPSAKASSRHHASLIGSLATMGLLAMTLIILRQGKFGRVTRAVRSVTGGSLATHYRNMAESGPAGWTAESELELSESNSDHDLA